jgi:N-acetylneuraminic acid mutarotase
MATFVIQGKIYVVGGGFKQPNGKFRFLKTVEVYNPQADRWEEGPEMLQPHDYPASALLGDQMYILGGHHPDATEGGPQTDPGFAFCERFDFASRGWVEIAPLPKPRFAAAAVAFDGKILAFGGVAFTGQGLTEYDRVEVYDPRKGDWSVASWKMPWSAAAHGACLHRGVLYFFGGFTGDQGIGTQAAHYDFTRGGWEKIPPLPEARAAMGVTVVGGSIYLVGGWAADRSVMDSVIAYTP